MKKWTEAELEAMGFNKVVVGVPGRPLPIMAPNPEASSQDTAYRLESIEDENNPLVIWSKRPYGEVIGMIYRLLPTPSMLPLYYETLQLLQVENERRIQFYIGKHGSGKSFLGRLVGDILHPDGAITINCADRDLNELLFETVLDVAANPDLYSKINSRLREGSMNKTSIAALRSVVGSAYHTDLGFPQIDFEKIGATQRHTHENEEGLTETEIIFSDADTQQVVETILRIAQVEGLSESASFMPIKSRIGMLPTTFVEGRVVHLEEYNKCKEGSDTALHPVLQVFNGENSKCTVYGSGGLSYTFDNEEREPGFFCYMDGNMMSDGVATHTLSASANDRLLPNIIQDMIKDDWQHRWSQLLTGMPIAILYKSKKDQWDQDPDGFTRFLLMIRGLGGKKIPPSQKYYIEHWENVLDATDIISSYNKLYDEMTNPDSPANRQGKYPELFAEVDDAFYNMAGGSMRRNIYYFKMAMLGRPGTKQPHLSQGYDLTTSWENPPEVDLKAGKYRPEEKMGTNIVDIFYRDMVRLTIGLGKINLYTRLKVSQESLRMVKPELNEGMIHDGAYLEDLLNADPRENDQSQELQALFCNLMRAEFPKSKMSDNDDHLMTQDQIRLALERAIHNPGEGSHDPRVRFMMAQNFAPLATVENLILPFAVIDSMPTLQYGSSVVRDEDLMGLDHFLISLALPKIGRRNQRNIWTETIFQAIDSPLAEHDEAVRISADKSDSGLAMLTVKTREDHVHLIRDNKKNNLLVVTGAISEAVEELFKEAEIDYIDRSAKNAKTRIRTFMNRATIRLPKDFDLFLVASLLHRNLPKGIDLTGNPQFLEKRKLPDLLTDPEVEPRYPLYATRLQERRQIDSYLEQTQMMTETQR